MKVFLISNTVLYTLLALGLFGLIVSLEWDNISKVKALDPKKIAVILIVLFFLGTAIAALFR